MGVLHQSLEQSPEPTPEPQPRDWLQMYWRCISWTSHCWPDISTNWRTMNLIPADVTWHQFLWYFWFEGRVVRCLNAARKTSTVAKKNLLSQATAPYNCSLHPNETMENIIGRKCRTCAKSYLGAAGGASASVGTPSRGEYEGPTNHEPLMHHGNRLVDGKSHATGKGPERFRTKSYQRKCLVRNSIWFGTATQKGGPTTFW